MDLENVQTVPDKFAATVSLFDPLANDLKYTSTSVIDLAHLMAFNLTHYKRITEEDLAAMPERQRRSWEGLVKDADRYFDSQSED